jgi:GNAT superfamily N-acetyltransferase
MNFKIEHNPQGIDNLAIVANINEPLDYDCYFITARDTAGHLVGVAGVNFDKEQYPRFEHIIVSPRFQKGKLSAILMRRMESWIRDLGYKMFVAFIYHEKKIMHHYAKKFLMSPFKESQKGIWYAKEVR